MEQKKEYKLYKRRWVVLLSFVCVNAVMQYGWAFFSSIVTDAWHFYGFQDAASGEAAISALTMIIMGCMITFSIPASWVFEKIGWYKTVSIAGIVLMVFTLLRGFIGGSSYTALVITTTGIAVTQPFIINAFGMISALWFPPAERGIANGWGMISTYLGVVMAQFGVPWLMSTFGLDIPGALKVFGFLSIPMILWFILFAREKPPTPPADEDLIERVSFADGMKQLVKNKKFIYALPDDLTLSTVCRLPDIFTLCRGEEDEEELAADVLSVLQKALEQFVAMRETEGERLKADVLSRLLTMEEHLSFVEERSPQTVAEYRARLTAKLTELLNGAVPDENRILTEVGIIADRLAVDEETVRLRSHFAQLRKILESTEPVGRKLDFLVQEMNRETNTIGSKCSDTAIAGHVVEMKSELEKIREQIQNIE